MSTTIRSTATLPKQPARLQQPRQLNIAFETTALRGLSAEQRTLATHALAALLLQAGDVRLQEDDDVEQ